MAAVEDDNRTGGRETHKVGVPEDDASDANAGRVFHSLDALSIYCLCWLLYTTFTILRSV